MSLENSGNTADVSMPVHYFITVFITLTERKFNHRLADQLTLYENITFFVCQKLIRINGPNST